MVDEISLDKETVFKIAGIIVLLGIGILIGLLIGYFQVQDAVNYANECYEKITDYCICNFGGYFGGRS